MNIAIIGAGPIGCYAAYLLAKNGHSVSVYEEHAEIGLPIQCTGLLTADFDQFHLLKESFLVNTFQELEVHSSQNKLCLQQKEYLVDRAKFDRYLADLAQQAGAQLFLEHSFLRREGPDLIIKNRQNKEELKITPDIIIAADGPQSKVAQAFGFYYPQRENYYGIQAVVEGKFEPQKYQTFFSEEICPEFFAWIVPESATRARVGLAAKKEAKKYFEQLILDHNFKIKETQAGLIPIYHPKQKLKRGHCYLLGDAAGFVKATTGGGIIPSMQQAQILAECLSSGKNYEREVQKLRRKLWLHLFCRKILNKFFDKDWDLLLKLMNIEKIKKTFEKETRENPLPLLVKLVLKEPRFLYFLKKLF